MQLPVLFAEHFTHASIKADPGWVPTSAGFFSLIKNQTYGASESLNMVPRSPEDDQLCRHVISSREAMIYFEQDTEANLAHMRRVTGREPKSKVVVTVLPL